jgi:SSS family solute:Na+ symporter
MQFTGADWVTVTVCLVLIFAPALFFARRAGRSMSEFFASGQSAPWWLAGTSMVATTFATDTPGLVTQLVREQGVAGNWMWWAFLLTGMATVFFYSRLWRRSGVLTDLEFYEIRYAGRPAAIVRGFRAVYLGLIFNCFIMAIVTLAAVKIANILFGIPAWKTILFATLFCSVIATVSGLWGVLVSDLIQFGIAMSGSLAAAYYALRHPEVEGLRVLLERLEPGTCNLLPDFGNWELTLTILIIPLTIQWWSTWYPGAEPGGGSYVAQRILASRNEKHALGATLWFNVAHYGLRPWPWILVGLASILVFPQLSDLQSAFPKLDENLLNHDIAYPAMLTFLPAGVLGLVTASLLAAYVSTMSTQLNWGASYLVNDLYRRFIRPQATQRELIVGARVLTVALMLASGSLVFVIESSRKGFETVLTIGAGTGLIYLLRWFWWRINAWSEISAMISSFVISMTILAVNHGKEQPVLSAHMALIITVGFTTVVWLLVTYLTRPTPMDKLESFYRLVRPAGPGWGRVRAASGLTPSPDSITTGLICWVASCTGIYCVLFGTGSLIYGQLPQAAVLLVVAAVAIAVLFAVLRMDWSREESRSTV